VASVYEQRVKTASVLQRKVRIQAYLNSQMVDCMISNSIILQQ